MKVQEILDRNAKLVTIRPEDTVETTAVLLSSNNIGAMPVKDRDGKLIGMLSERDIVRGFAQKGGRIFEMRVSDLMTVNVVTCKPDDTLREIGEVMSKRHIRHLPVMEGDTLVGMISLRDVMENRLEMSELEANVLRETVIATGASQNKT